MNKISPTDYLNCIVMLLKSPQKFFRNLPKDTKFKYPFIFLLISAFLSTLIFIGSTSFEPFYITGSIYYINAVGMTFVTSFAGFLSIRLFLRNEASFSKCFSVFAYSTGVSVIGAGVPFLIWFAEIWKWWLVAAGLKNHLKFAPFPVFIVIVVSIALVYVFFNAIVPASGLLS